MLHCIQCEGEACDQVRKAVQAARGEDRIITGIEEESAWLGPSFPEGTRYFHVRSENRACKHEPRCIWHNQVFHCKDRCVVLTPIDMQQTSVATVVSALKGQEAHG